MNKIICSILLLTMYGTAFSNDTRTMFGGSVEILNNENTNVIMEEETINIILHKDYYEVEVVFNFFNSGEAENILLGFPIKSHYQPIGGNENWGMVDDFKSYINGNLIENYIVKEEIIDDDAYGHYVRKTRWYLREALFPGNAYTYSRVTYKSPYGHGASYLRAGYIYGTGYNWKNAIGKMTINISHGDDVRLQTYEIGKKGPNELRDHFLLVGNGKYRFELFNIEPIVTDEIRLFTTECNMYNAKYNEFGDNWEGWIWDEHLLYNDEYKIILLTKNQIRLFINFFYAIHGYNFKNEQYKRFFSNIYYLPNADKKYTVNTNFSENDFNEIERKNIDYLLWLERMIP